MRLSETDIAVHPLLAGLKAEWLNEVGQCSTQARYAPGQHLLRAGERANRIHLIQSGRVGLEVKSDGLPESQVAIMGPGDVLACPGPGKAVAWQFSARSFDRVTTQSISVNRLRDLTARNPQLGFEMTHRILCALNEQLTSARRQFAEVSRLALSSQQLALQVLGGRRELKIGA